MDASESTPTSPTSLPENAYTELAPGEVYQPIVPATEAPPEVTRRSLGWGIFLCVLFTVASAYSGLKVGQVMEAAIPISILAIGLARIYARRSTLLENVIITAIGGVSGSVVAGAIFTLPASHPSVEPASPADDLHLPCRRCLGVLFIIPPGATVRETHGKFRTPRRSPSRGPSPARRADPAKAAGIHRHRRRLRLFQTTFQVWKETIDSVCPVVKAAAEKAKSSEVRRAGSSWPWLRDGLRSSMILCAGGAFEPRAGAAHLMVGRNFLK